MTGLSREYYKCSSPYWNRERLSCSPDSLTTHWHKQAQGEAEIEVSQFHSFQVSDRSCRNRYKIVHKILLFTFINLIYTIFSHYCLGSLCSISLLRDRDCVQKRNWNRKPLTITNWITKLITIHSFTLQSSAFYSPHLNILPVLDAGRKSTSQKGHTLHRKDALLRRKTRQDASFAERIMTSQKRRSLFCCSYVIIICKIYFILHCVKTYQSGTANFTPRSLSACTKTRFDKSGRTKTSPSVDLPLHSASPAWILCTDLFLKVSNFLSLRSWAPSSTTKESTPRESRASKNDRTTL